MPSPGHYLTALLVLWAVVPTTAGKICLQGERSPIRFRRVYPQPLTK